MPPGSPLATCITPSCALPCARASPSVLLLPGPWVCLGPPPLAQPIALSASWLLSLWSALLSIIPFCHSHWILPNCDVHLLQNTDASTLLLKQDLQSSKWSSKILELGSTFPFGFISPSSLHYMVYWNATLSPWLLLQPTPSSLEPDSSCNYNSTSSRKPSLIQPFTINPYHLHLSVLVNSGCHNKISYTGCFEQRMFIFSQFWRLKVQD